MFAFGNEQNANGQTLPVHWKRTIAIIWTGQAASVLATCAATFAVIWHITTSEDSALALAAVGIAALLPTALLSPFGGVAADRFNKKHLMIAADGAAGAFSLAMAVLALAEALPLWLLLGLLVVRSAAQAFHGPALMALMPELVPERDMVRINTLDQALSSLSAIGGPALGILLYTAWGFSAVLVMDAACAAMACACLAIAQLPYAHGASEHAVHNGVMVDLREGLSAIMSDAGMRALLGMAMVAMLLFLPLSTLSPLMTYDWFGGDGFAASLVEAAGGIGLLVGSVAMMAWGGGKKLVRVLVMAGVAIGACCIICGLLPRDGFSAFTVVIGAAMAAVAAFNAPVIPLMQKRIDPAKFGRVMGLFGALTTLAYPVGLFVAGPAADALGINCWFVVIGVALCVTMAAFSLCRPLRALDAPATEASDENANARDAASAAE